jgi:hypothetical protein
MFGQSASQTWGGFAANCWNRPPSASRGPRGIVRVSQVPTNRTALKELACMSRSRAERFLRRVGRPVLETGTRIYTLVLAAHFEYRDNAELARRTSEF